MSYTIKDILRMAVAPALGCTEPSAVALAAAAAASLLPEKRIDTVELWVDPNIYKNGLAVAIPGARGATGIDLAALLGIFKGDSSLRLEVLDKVDDDSLEKAKEFIRDHPVGIEVLNDKKIIYIRVKITAGSDTAEAVIEELHDNIVSLSLNGKSLKGHKLLSNTARTQDSVHKMEA
jgi:L-cysteine desulfidase